MTRSTAHSTTPTEERWEINADEWRAISKQGTDLHLAALVACSSFKGKATDKINIPFGKLGKVPSSRFATRAVTGPARVLRHLDAWEALAAAGLVLPAAECTPDMANSDAIFLVTDMDAVKAKFSEVFRAETAGSRPRAPISEISAAIESKTGYVDKFVAEMSDEAFEALQEAMTNATVDAPTAPVITPTGVTPAPTPSPAKVKAVTKMAEKVRDAKVRTVIEDLKRKSPPRVRPAPDPAADGAVPTGGIKRIVADDSLWELDVLSKQYDKSLTMLAEFPGKLTGDNAEFVTEVMTEVNKKHEDLGVMIEAKESITDAALESFIDGS